MTDVVIVGGGIFGQVIAKALRQQGRDVTVMDCNEEGAGSKPAACLMKPSWFSGLGKGVYEPSLKLLDELYGIEDIEFALKPLKALGKVGSAKVHWVNPEKILGCGLITKAQVVGINGKCIHYKDLLDGHMKSISARLIIVAAGVWTERLLPQYKQQAQRGVAFLYKGINLREPYIRPWAPYKQLVAFNRGDGLWVSDGTAIKAENWTEDRVTKAQERCEGDLAEINPMKSGYLRAGLPKILTGLRPYAKGHKPCLLEEVEPGVFVASGGAKNGTLAAGWCAHEIVSRTS